VPAEAQNMHAKASLSCTPLPVPQQPMAHSGRALTPSPAAQPHLVQRQIPPPVKCARHAPLEQVHRGSGQLAPCGALGGRVHGPRREAAAQHTTEPMSKGFAHLGVGASTSGQARLLARCSSCSGCKARSTLIRHEGVMACSQRNAEMKRRTTPHIAMLRSQAGCDAVPGPQDNRLPLALIGQQVQQRTRRLLLLVPVGARKAGTP
jgi:hypothetical protein